MTRFPSRQRDARAPDRPRAAFTLLEVLLASAIGMLIMYGVYLAIDIQLRFAESGRAQVDQATLSRSLMARITADVEACIGLADPSRYQQQSQGGSSGSGGTTATTTTPTGTTSTTTSSTTGSTSGSSSSSSSSSSSTTNSMGQDDPTNPLRGVFGDATTLRLWISRVPPVLSNPALANSSNVPLVCDQRVVQYWLSSKGGLGRQEISTVSTNASQVNFAMGSGTESQYIIAPEVTELLFRYFDGTEWQPSWNSYDPGADGVTPIGPPAAIEVNVTIKMSSGRTRKFRHVVAIPTANGQPLSTTSPDSQNSQSGGSGSSSGSGGMGN